MEDYPTKSETLRVRVRPETKDQLKTIADQYELDMSTTVRALIEEQYAFEQEQAVNASREA